MLAATNRDYMETLGFISHELKAPLGGIMNYTYLLEQEKTGTLNERQIKAVKSIDRTTKRLTEMVRHYLNLSRIENGELNPLRSRVVVLGDIVLPILDSQDADIKEKAMIVENRIAADTLVHADYNMTHEVFENLISNAVKYGNEGGTITLTADANREFVRFTVRNTGVGIAEQDSKKIFEKFVRVDSSKNGKNSKGTGLGLFVTRHILDAHGCGIDMKSEPGAYVEFVFTLPAYAGQEAIA
jgi:two-component system phosphate regulon sensor histidine kinase PhoR